MGRWKFEHLDKLKTPPLPDVKGRIWGPSEPKREVPKTYRLPYGTTSTQTEALRDTHPAAPHGGHVPCGGNVTPDEDPEDPKLKWRQCVACKGVGEGFRLACLSFGQTQCRQCIAEERLKFEEAKYRLTTVEKQADRFLKAHGVKLSWKRGGKQIR